MGFKFLGIKRSQRAKKVWSTSLKSTPVEQVEVEKPGFKAEGPMDEMFSPVLALVERIMGDRASDIIFVTVQGVREIESAKTRDLCERIGGILNEVGMAFGKQVVLLCGPMHGVQNVVSQSFAKHGNSGVIYLTPQVSNVIKAGSFSKGLAGHIIQAGNDSFERKVIHANLTDVFILIDPGSAALEEAMLAAEGGSFVLPIFTNSTGMWSRDMDFEKPSFVTKHDWSRINSPGKGANPTRVGESVRNLIWQYSDYRFGNTEEKDE